MTTLDSRLLRALREARVHLPAGDLAAQLGEPVAVVRSRIAEWRAAGFEIEERPALGFRLVGTPDRLVADDLAARLGACPMVREILVYEETGSTNELALQRGRQGTPAGLAIFAERQTAGRGRFGRRWVSASHCGLWFSLLLRPDWPLAQWSRLTTWAAVAVAAAVEQATGQFASIKWPNDVFLGGKKVAGILIESGAERPGEEFAVVGIGLNVNHQPSDFPSELLDRAGSLRTATGRIADRAALAAEILTQLDARHEKIGTAFAELIEEASCRSFLLGRWVKLQAGTQLIEGRAEGLDEQGQLLLRVDDGSLQSFIAGEVTVVRDQGKP